MKIFKKLVLFNAFFLIFFISQSNANVEKIATEIVKELPDNVILAIQPLDRKKANISMASASGIIEKFTNEIQRALSNSSSSLIDRSKLEAIMLEQEEFQNIEEFSNLIENTGADILIGISLARINSSSVEISARSFGVKGNLAGQVISASKTYKIDLPQSFVIKVKSIKQGQKDRKKYLSSFIDGISNFNEIEVTSQNIANHQLDYIIDINFEFDISERETEESKQAAEQAKGLALFGSLANNMVQPGKTNPFAALTQTEDNSADLKQLVFITNAEAKILKVSNNSELYSTSESESSAPINSSEGDKKKNAGKSVKDALYVLGDDVGSKITGSKSSSSSGGSLLD